MKPAPAPHVPGDTESERFSNAVRKLFSSTKEDVAEAERKWKREREQARKKRAKKT